METITASQDTVAGACRHCSRPARACLGDGCCRRCHDTGRATAHQPR